MNTATLESIKNELAVVLPGSRFGKVFQLSRVELAIDLRLPDSRCLYLNVSPGEPRAYLITRRIRDLEKTSGNPSAFLLTLRKKLSGGSFTGISRLNDRVLELTVVAEDEMGSVEPFVLVVQLTGRSANLFLTNADLIILDRIRDTSGEGQQTGEFYSPPQRPEPLPAREIERSSDQAAANSQNGPSEALDSYYSELAAEKLFSDAARAARGKISTEIKKRVKLLMRLRTDLAEHGEPDEWKRLGDLLLANIATARREGDRILVSDYFQEGTPEVAIEADENLSVSDAAAKFYRRYSKARNGAVEIANRIEKVSAELSLLEARLADIERAILEKDLSPLEERSLDKGPPNSAKTRAKAANQQSAARSFLSSEGFEILVGKKAKDNDILTFKIARSLDTWMHAADYPGSHVIVRNPNRKEIPHKTLIEAAQLAAFYSQGKTQIKAAVHYTLKKFVNKPKGSAPGLVSLSSFKTILVIPDFPLGVNRKDQ